MNKSIEVSAPSVDEAIKRGLALLGLSREQVQIQVVEEGRRGILGIGTREATVRLETLSPVEDLTPLTRSTSPVEEETEDEFDEEWQEDEITVGEELNRQGYELSNEQITETARQVLVELLNKMGIEADISVHPGEPDSPEASPITLNIHGENLDMLIGHHGKVLSALQHIARLIVSREVSCWVDLVVDVEMYKQRRASSLKKLAERMAERVAQSKQPIALEPMPPNERREIHIALRNHPMVTTQSVGRGDDRKVTIIPRR